MFAWLKQLLGRAAGGRSLDELASWLGVSAEQLRGVQPHYQEFTIRKKRGGARRIFAPGGELQRMQRRILRRLLRRLPVHPAATGFRRGHSIVTNALPHAGRAVVVRMDIKDFFPSISARRIQEFFRAIGWSRPAAERLVELCTHQDQLPQGAPTSPCLSNLVNYRLDARLNAAAARYEAVYTRYADDLTFSFSRDDAWRINRLLVTARLILADEKYRINYRKKIHVRRRHQRQVVTGLVVNEGVGLSRDRRRWLRAVEHRMQSARQPRPFELSESPWRKKRPTLTPEQLAGWKALRRMIEVQAKG